MRKCPEIGKNVKRQFTVCGESITLWGTVAWVHPKNRYYIVEFPCNGHILREGYHAEAEI